LTGKSSHKFNPTWQAQGVLRAGALRMTVSFG
jgi:hypothetical protein